MRRLTKPEAATEERHWLKGRCRIGHAAWRRTMGGKIDQMKGRIKEAVGVLTDDDSLKNEGKLDQAVGEVKETAERVAKTVKEIVAKAVEKVKDA